jgi:antitoxin PrlF
MESKITAGGRMTLPKAAREFLGVKPGDKVKIFIDPPGRVVILPVIPVTALKGIAKSPRSRPITIEEMDEAVRVEAVARYLRATAK